MNYRIGYGEDAHALTKGRPLTIGGVTIPDAPHGAVAHSDGDALLHALSDALLSSLALHDIGYYFPPSDPKWRGLDSSDIVAKTLLLLREKADETGRELEIVNVSVVVTLDRPKLGPYRGRMQVRVAELLGVPAPHVGLGFKTSEGLAPAHIQTRVTVLVKLS